MFTVLRSEVLTVSLKRRGWCWWLFCSECGVTVVQLGFVIVEF